MLPLKFTFRGCIGKPLREDKREWCWTRSPNHPNLALIMRSRALLLLILGLSTLTQLRGQNPQPGEPVFRVNVRLVQVDTQVLNKKTHHAVRALKKDDFEIYEDNVRQQVSSFSQDTLPLSVVLLFDLTDSVRPVLKSLGEGALEALHHLK